MHGTSLPPLPLRCPDPSRLRSRPQRIGGPLPRAPGRSVALPRIPRCPAPLGSETQTSCRDLVVLVNQAIEAIPAPNAGGSRNRIRPSPDLDTPGRTKCEASVRPLIVVVPHVLVENPFKVTPTPDQHPIQALLPDASYPPLRDRVGVRRLDGCLDDLNAVGGEDIVEGAGELGIAVTEQESTRCDVLRTFRLNRELSCALHHPRSIRMVGDASKPNLSSVQFDEEQDVESLEPHGLHGE